MRRWPRSTKTMKPTTATMRAPRKIIFSGSHGPGLHAGHHAGEAGREADDDAGEDDERDAVADAALRDLLAQPHDEDGPVVRVRTVSNLKPQPGLRRWTLRRGPNGLEEDGDAEGLDQADADRAVAGVLVIFFRPSSPSLDRRSR